jgi:glutathione S-transferase
MIELYYVPATASMAPHIVLEELGIAYTLKRIDQDGGELDSPAYRQLNPNGLIPVLIDNGNVLFETAAICLHLSDCNPHARLMPAEARPERAQAYKWMSWLSTTLQQALIVYFYPQRWATTEDAIAQVKAHAEQKVQVLLDQLDTQLASHNGPWLLGDNYLLPDLYAMMLCRWTRNFAGRKARDLPHIASWLQRVLARPAVQRVYAREEIQQPWV